MPINVNAPNAPRQEKESRDYNPLDDIAKAVGVATNIYGVIQKGNENDIRAKQLEKDAAIQKQEADLRALQMKDLESKQSDAAALKIPNSPQFQAEKKILESQGIRVPEEIKTLEGLRTPSMSEAYKAALETKKGLALKSKETSEVDKTERKKSKEFLNRYSTINSEIAALEKMIDEKGTFELFGPHNKEMQQKLDSIAIDSAKLFDPESVAREGEVAAFKNMLFEGGALSSSNDTAKKLLSSYRDQLSRRAGSMGLDVSGARNAPGSNIKSESQISDEMRQAAASELARRRAAGTAATKQKGNGGG